MKKVVINLNDAVIVGSHENLGPFIQAIENSNLYIAEGWGDNRKFIPSEKEASIEIIDDSLLQEKPEPLVDLQEKLRTSEKRWYEYYNKFQEEQKKVMELEEKLEGLKKELI